MWQWCQLAVVCLGAALAHGLLTDLKLDDRSLPGWRGEAELTGATDIIRYGKKSTVADNETGENIPSTFRTSTGTFLDHHQTSVVARIEARIAQVTMVPMENQEGMQILRYINGQKYEPHHDYFSDKYNQDPKHGGQRLVTVLMYLTTVEEGGETVFPWSEPKVTGPQWSECAKEGLAVKPVRGDAVMFFSLNPDGTEDPTSLHGSCPTVKGEKWSATKWIHTGVSREMQHEEGRGQQGRDQSIKDKKPCSDKMPKCTLWAENGECESNKAWMVEHCPKVCNAC